MVMNTRKILFLTGITAICLALVYLFYFEFPENKNSSPKEFTIGSPFNLVDHRGMVITEKDFLQNLNEESQNKLQQKEISDYDRYMLNHKIDTIKEITI